MKQTYLVDTNILLRYLMNDDARQGPAVKRLIEQATCGEVALEVPQVAILEAVFTLQSYYQVAREDIGRELLKVLRAEGVALTCPDWILDALEYYRTRNVSFGDACLAAEAAAGGKAIASFDRGFKLFPEIERFEPM
ncbi:MAG TPA: PIN domain-containing protein [Opitutaceae bacterium]|jgi:predicted nucleic-acid-binding protein|nr:PIN domain-containing protein [Opitutaceae bacterium]